MHDSFAIATFRNSLPAVSFKIIKSLRASIRLHALILLNKFNISNERLSPISFQILNKIQANIFRTLKRILNNSLSQISWDKIVEINNLWIPIGHIVNILPKIRKLLQTILLRKIFKINLRFKFSVSPSYSRIDWADGK